MPAGFHEHCTTSTESSACDAPSYIPYTIPAKGRAICLDKVSEIKKYKNTEIQKSSAEDAPSYIGYTIRAKGRTICRPLPYREISAVLCCSCRTFPEYGCIIPQ